MPKKPAESSSRPALVLLHGFRGSPIGLTEIANNLRNAGYQVFVPPVAPFGGASPLKEYTPESYAKFVADFIKYKKLKQPILIGHSMGSIIAAATAANFPELINQKIIFLSPISTKVPRPIAAITPLSGYTPREFVNFWTTKYLFVPKNPQLFEEVMTATRACANDHAPTRREVVRSAVFSAKYDIADFPLNGKKVTLIAGEHDRLITRKRTEVAAEQLNYKLTFLPNTGHLHNYEQPRETALAILEAVAD